MRPTNAEAELASRLARKTALLSIDVQRAFFAEDGSFALVGDDTAPMRRILPAIGRLQARAREAGLLLAHVKSEGPSWLNWPRHVAPPRMLESMLSVKGPLRMLEPGSRDVEFATEALPQKGEPVVTKHVFDAFIGTPLDWLLHRAGIETVVVCGLTTEGCVETSARSALGHGYAVVVAEDAVATSDPELHAASLRVLGERFGIVASSDEIGTAGGWPPV